MILKKKAELSLEQKINYYDFVELLDRLEIELSDYAITNLFRDCYLNGGGILRIESILATLNESNILIKLVSVKGKLGCPQLDEKGFIEKNRMMNLMISKFYEYR